MKNKNNKLYRAIDKEGNWFDLEANNKNEVKDRIIKFGFDLNGWEIKRIE